jgi:hypothetical protein
VLAVLLLVMLLPSDHAAGDGGTVRLLAPAGPFIVTIFSAPEPLRVGAADLSVLVQDRARGTAVLDARVSLTVTPPYATASTQLEATRGHAANKLVYGAAFAPDSPGEWSLHARVQRGDEVAEVACALPVAPATPGGIVALWPYLILPPVVVGLYALHAWARSSRHARVDLRRQRAQPR